MKSELNSKIPYNKAITTLSVLAAISGVLCAVLGELVLPFAVAFLSALLVFEKSTYKITSIIISAVILISNTVIGIFNGAPIPVIAITVILISFVISCMYSKRINKGECVFIVTVIMTLMLILSFMLIAIYSKNEFSINAIKLFYTDIYENLKADFVKTLTDITSTLENGNATVLFSVEDATRIFNTAVNSLISVIVILAFVISGISFKLFSAVVIRLEKNPMKIVEWRFTTSNVFVYAYIALAVISFLIAGEGDVLAITVSNLYSILSFVYAYIGFNYVKAIISTARRPAFLWLLLVFACIFATSLALGILSIFGVFFTITHNKITRSS